MIRLVITLPLCLKMVKNLSDYCVLCGAMCVFTPITYVHTTQACMCAHIHMCVFKCLKL
jgi:hypothetical protein